MNFCQYCKKNQLNISGLSSESIDALANMYLENVNPTQEKIDRLVDINAGKISIENAMNLTLKKAKDFAGSDNKKYAISE